jgi:hypothetical protein
MRDARRSRPGQQWYVNDHCFIVADDGMIHWFGITNPYPEEGVPLYGPGTHRHIGHAVSPAPFGPWEERPHALELPQNTRDSIGACFVAKHNGRYVMVYGNHGFAFACSEDLDSWQTLRGVPRVRLGENTRDPCIITSTDGSYLLYGAVGHEGAGAVGLASSEDLLQWNVVPPALVSDVAGDWGRLESPFVHQREDGYYLFVNHSHRQYEETLVFHGADPTSFDWGSPLCTLFAHAAEILEFDGRTYISHCGIEDRHWQDGEYGLWLAELAWQDGVSP